MIIGIMGAMPDEVDQLCAKLENVTVEPYGGVEYHRGTLAGKQVVVCCAGMGKANAAATTQVLITRYGAEKIIFSAKDADLLRNRKVNTKKRQNRHLPELAFLILGTYFTAPFTFVLSFYDSCVSHKLTPYNSPYSFSVP